MRSLKLGYSHFDIP